MEQYCKTLSENLQKDLATIERSGLSGLRKIESCYQLAVSSWVKLSRKLQEYQFTSEDREIHFFKNGKPLITAEIEYCHLRYHALLFEPQEPVYRTDFWDREYNRLERFRAKHETFIECYEAEQHKLQPWYFLRKYYVVENATRMGIYDSGHLLSTNGDWLTATLLALEKYQEYVKKELGV